MHICFRGTAHSCHEVGLGLAGQANSWCAQAELLCGVTNHLPEKMCIINPVGLCGKHHLQWFILLLICPLCCRGLSARRCSRALQDCVRVSLMCVHWFVRSPTCWVGVTGSPPGHRVFVCQISTHHCLWDKKSTNAVPCILAWSRILSS